MKAHPTRPVRVAGINHVAIEVGDVDEALSFYGRIFEIRLRGRSRGMAFVDLGDQVIALSEGREQAPDGYLDFLDPWGNHVQVVQYDEVQFTKAAPVLRGMGLQLEKTDAALGDLAAKGMAPGSVEQAGQ